MGSLTATGRALVVDSAAEAFDRLRDGDILIAPYTGPSWNSLLPMLRAIVVEEGGPMCHAAIVAREFDIPASGRGHRRHPADTRWRDRRCRPGRRSVAGRRRIWTRPRADQSGASARAASTCAVVSPGAKTRLATSKMAPPTQNGARNPNSPASRPPATAPIGMLPQPRNR